MLFYDSFCIYPCYCYVHFREKIKLSVSVSVITIISPYILLKLSHLNIFPIFYVPFLGVGLQDLPFTDNRHVRSIHRFQDTYQSQSQNTSPIQEKDFIRRNCTSSL